MSLLESIRIALNAIRANALRSALTILMIVIGVGCVIIGAAFGSGTQAAVQEQMSTLGANVLSIYPGQSFGHGRVASSNRVSLTIDDYDALRRDSQFLSAVVPELRSSRQVKFGNKNIHGTITGTTPNYLVVNNRELTHGRMITQSDLAARRRVAVLGYSIPTSFEFAPTSLLGRDISIGRIIFKVVGVFAEVGSGGYGPSVDDAIYIPLTTARFRVFGSDRLGSLSAEVKENIGVDMAMVDIERVLRREHKIRPGDPNDFTIMNRSVFSDMMQSITSTLSTYIIGILAISLLIGAIGILSIMLVSVTERTREIGVRKALGATRGNILTQFIVEAITLGALGGLFGIILGWLGSEAISSQFDMPLIVEMQTVLIAVAVSVSVGFLAGVWPAYVASKLDPIEALRHD